MTRARRMTDDGTVTFLKKKKKEIIKLKQNLSEEQEVNRNSLDLSFQLHVRVRNESADVLVFSRARH